MRGAERQTKAPASHATIRSPVRRSWMRRSNTVTSVAIDGRSCSTRRAIAALKAATGSNDRTTTAAQAYGLGFCAMGT